jgi:8-oxoguanine DNA glycosylase-like protein
MLRTPGADAIVREIVAAARMDAGRGFSALFARGRSRISSLGIAFGTKVVHFAGYDHAEPRPVILDARVFAAAHILDPLAPVPNPARYTTGEQYRTYCELADDVAARNHVEPEDVEYALFVHAGR